MNMNEIGTSTVKITGNFFPNADTWPGWNYQPAPFVTIACRNYKCVCGGEFNEPGGNYDVTTGTATYWCPFCEKKMNIRGK